MRFEKAEAIARAAMRSFERSAGCDTDKSFDGHGSKSGRRSPWLLVFRGELVGQLSFATKPLKQVNTDTFQVAHTT
jgi:hypothetical protein